MSSIHMKVGLADGREQLTRNITMLRVKSIFTIFNFNETKFPEINAGHNRIEASARLNYIKNVN